MKIIFFYKSCVILCKPSSCFKINNMKYTLTCLLLLMMAVSFINAPRKITGIVYDEKNTPLPYASVMVKGTQTAVSTGMDGSFAITVNNDNAVLVISSVGFETTEVKVGRKQQVSIHLKTVQQALEEVVVIGYGKQQKRDVTGSVTTIHPSAPLVSQQLQGRVAGVSVGSPKYIGESRRRPNLDDTRGFNREGYDNINENTFLKVTDNPLSTFSIDVDAASYSNVRRILKEGRLPQQGAVRVEEMINYFKYDYEQPGGNDPFAVHMELGVCPWNTKHQLALIGLQGKKTDVSKLPPSNLTFLIDVSGSMMSADKLPLVKESLKLLVNQLREEDKVSIVVYAGSAGLVLSPTSGDQKLTIRDAIDRLEAGGSTAGGAGIQLAYKTARENYRNKGNNRVILCTDGDFNVGASSDDALERMIEEERKSGVFLTVLGYGTGNYQDSKMQKLADKGNGNHAYIDQLSEAKKVLSSEFGGTLFTIAKDVKLQLEFNPAKVKGYRLIGYENRMLAKEDFNNDQKDAGDLGSGHTVTALYEIVPAGVDMPGAASVDPLRYQANINGISTGQPKFADEILNVKLRYKQPDGDKSKLLSFALQNKVQTAEQLSDNFRFASAVASFGMLLRNSEYKGNSSFDSVLNMARNAVGKDEEGYRKEFLQMVNRALSISKGADNAFNK
jgi:Ca-activated chloride channel family protein